jgi:hypothetical protein
MERFGPACTREAFRAGLFPPNRFFAPAAIQLNSARRFANFIP